MKENRKAAGLVLAALSLCLPATGFAAEQSFDRTLTVNGPVTLRVATGSGNIRVSPGSDNQVHVVGHVKSNHNSWFGGSTDDAVGKVVQDPPISQAGNIIRIGDTGNEWMHHVSIDYEVTAPPNTMLSADSGSGDLKFSNITGTVRGHTGSGSIEADKVGAGSKLDTGSGSITASNLMGPATLSTGSGEIHAQLGAAGDVSAETGSGSIRLENVQGGLKAETGSGSLDISGQPTSPWKLETGSGDVTLKVGNAHFNLDAETGSGSVKSDSPITTRLSDKHHVSGTVNGGGPTVKVETGSGDIHIM
jgi:DUF4097 and DUF4098 domain-containing protein YvlB